MRHCLYVKHIKKNGDSIIGTLLNISGKTKYTIKYRLDFVKMHIREQLAPEKKGKNAYLSLVIARI